MTQPPINGLRAVFGALISKGINAKWHCGCTPKMEEFRMNTNYDYSKRKKNTNYTECIVQRSTNSEGVIKKTLTNENVSIDQCDCEGFLIRLRQPTKPFSRRIGNVGITSDYFKFKLWMLCTVVDFLFTARNSHTGSSEHL